MIMSLKKKEALESDYEPENALVSDYEFEEKGDSRGGSRI